MVSVSGGILDNVFRAVQEAKETAVSKKEVQTIDVYSRGHRVDVSWGKIMIIPPSVCDSFENIPAALRNGAGFREFTGDDWANFESYRLAESEFETPDQKLIDEFKNRVFKGEGNRFVPVILFQPSWSYSRDAIIVRWIKDDARLKEAIRHLCFGAYFDPAHSSMFNAMVTTEDRLSTDNITGHTFISAFGWSPESEDPSRVGAPLMEKKASNGHIRIAATSDNLKRIMAILDAKDEDTQKDEEDAFFESLEEVLMNVTPDKEEVKEAKVASEAWFLPGQVIKEFYPEMQEDMLRYPVQNNSGMPESMSCVSDIPAPATLNPKPSVLQESVPLRREMELRGPGFMDDFYRSVVTIDPSHLMMAAGKKAAEEVDPKAEMINILQGVCGEIVATLLAAYRVTQKPLAMGVPGDGTVSLNPNIPGSPCVTVSPQMDLFLHDRIVTMCSKLNDGDLQEVVNQAWAQGAVWCDGDKGGFTYEVLVRTESFDDATLELKYKYLVNTK
jgi:hypothetical protein